MTYMFSNLANSLAVNEAQVTLAVPSITYVIISLVIALASIVVSLCFVYIPLKRKDTEYKSAFFIVALFIAFCGLAQLLEIVSYWWPLNQLPLTAKAVTAVIAVFAFYVVKKSVPKLLEMPSVKELGAVNDELEVIRYQLEHRVETRTRELTESKDKLDLALSASGIGTWCWRLSTDTIEWDDHMLRLFGVNENEAPKNAEEFTHLMHPADVAIFQEAVEKTIQEGGLLDFVFHIIRHEEIRALTCRGRVLVNSEGKPVKITGIILDITEELAARTAKNHLAAIVESSDDAIISMTLGGKVVSWNKGAEKLIGINKEQAVGKRFTNICAWEDDQRLASILNKLKQDENKTQFIETKINAEGKSPRYVQISLSPIKEERVHYDTGISAIVRDVTQQKIHEQKVEQAGVELKAANENLREQKARAEKATKAKSTFLANISHEIRTPLNAVLGYSQLLLQDAQIDQKHHRALQSIESAGNHLLNLINDVLDLSRIDAGAAAVSSKNFNLVELVNEVKAMFTVPCSEKNLNWKVYHNLAQDLCVTGDKQKIRQVLINLIGNAIKFTDAGTIQFRVHKHGYEYHFSVEDEGPGLTTEEVSAIVEPFSRGSAVDHKPGSGLGLSIVTKLLEMMCGQLRIESEPYNGSKFTINLRLPAANKAEIPSCEKESVSYFLPADQLLRVLVVDDVPMNRDVLSQMLRNAGVTVVTANDGQEAVDLVNDSEFDFIFMDIRMPIMDGMDALQLIRRNEKYQTVPICAISAASMEHSKEHYLKLGFDSYIVKPFHFSDIFECIAKQSDIEFTKKTSQILSKQNNETQEADIELQFEDYIVPDEMYGELVAAAEQGRVNRIEELSTQMCESRKLSALGGYIHKLAQSFDLRSINRILKEVQHG